MLSDAFWFFEDENDTTTRDQLAIPKMSPSLEDDKLDFEAAMPENSTLDTKMNDEDWLEFTEFPKTSLQFGSSVDSNTFTESSSQQSGPAYNDVLDNTSLMTKANNFHSDRNEERKILDGSVCKKQAARRARKRCKTSYPSRSASGDRVKPTVDHNIVEREYRRRISDQFDQLRSTLSRVNSHNEKFAVYGDDADTWSKGTVLELSRQTILYLERQNMALTQNLYQLNNSRKAKCQL